MNKTQADILIVLVGYIAWMLWQREKKRVVEVEVTTERGEGETQTAKSTSRPSLKVAPKVPA